MTTTVAPPRRPPLDPEALFEEARRHRRRRRARIGLLAAVLVVAGATGYLAFGGGTAALGLGDGSGAGAAPRDRAVVLLIDVSGSMRADDVKPTRLEATVTALKAFVARLPDDLEIGVVAFSTTAKVVLAPTRSHRAVRNALDSLEPLSGTALGDGLDAALKLTARMPKPAAVVLESDGAQNRGSVLPLEAARHAKTDGIRVDAVALGTPSGAVQLGYGRFQNSIPVPPDPKTVAEIARVTGGQAFDATTARALGTIYRRLAERMGG